MKLKRTPSRRELAQIQFSDVHRNTKAHVKSHHGRSFPRWRGLPKPASLSDFTPLETVTKGVLEKLGREADPVLRVREREEAKEKRAQVVAYLTARQTS